MDIFDRIKNSNEVNFNILLHKKFQRIFYTESLCFGDIITFYNDKDDAYLLFQKDYFDDTENQAILDSIYPIPEQFQFIELTNINRCIDPSDNKLTIEMKFNCPESLKLKYSNFSNDSNILLDSVKLYKIEFKDD